MVTNVADRGVIVNKTEKEYPEKKIDQAVNSVSLKTIGKLVPNELDLIELRAKHGSNHLFQIRGTNFYPTIKLTGISDKNILDRYLAFPAITKALHACILASVAEENRRAGHFLSFYCARGDAEGVRSLMSAIIQNPQLRNQMAKVVRRHINKAIVNGHVKVLEVLLSYFPLSDFSDYHQRAMMSEACKFGYVEIEKLLKSKGCACSSQDQVRSHLHQQWFEAGGAEKQFPALFCHKGYNRSLNRAQLELYGGEAVQKTYHEEQRKNLKFALLLMKESEKSDDFLISFRHFLLALGQRRRHTAYASHSKRSRDFGDPRSDGITVPVIGAYAGYGDRLKANAFTQLTLNGKTFILKMNKDSLQKPVHVYYDFWRENDPLFFYAANLYRRVVTHEFKDKEELRKIISDFHWLLSNNPPFDRGTAAILETITDAMWLFHGYMPQPLEAGKSLDLEALCTPKMDDFAATYPMGKKIAP